MSAVLEVEVEGLVPRCTDELVEVFVVVDGSGCALSAALPTPEAAVQCYAERMVVMHAVESADLLERRIRFDPEHAAAIRSGFSTWLRYVSEHDGVQVASLVGPRRTVERLVT